MSAETIEILINSDDRSSGSPGDYIINLPYGTNISEKYDTLAVSQIVMKGSVYNVHNSTPLYIKRRVTQITPNPVAPTLGSSTVFDLVPIILPEGNYDEYELLTVLNSSISNANIFEGNNLEMSFNFNEITHKLEYTFTGSNIHLNMNGVTTYVNDHTVFEVYAYSMADDIFLKSRGINPEMSLNRKLGFFNQTVHDLYFYTRSHSNFGVVLKKEYDEFFARGEADGVPTIFNPGSTLLLCSDMILNPMISSSDSIGGAFSVVPYSNTGEYTMQEYVTEHRYLIQPSVKTTMRFYWRTPTGNPVEFEGGVQHILLRFYDSRY